MFDPTLYREACDRMALPNEKLEEMIQMTTEQTAKRPRRALRVALIAAACVAALTVTAFAAVPAVQQLFIGFTINAVDETGARTDVVCPVVELRHDGERTILVVNDEEIDITDDLAKDGAYTYQQGDVTINVDGGGHISMSFGGDGIDVDSAQYHFFQGGEQRHPNEDEVQEQYTVLPGPNGEMNIYDSHGNLVDTDLPAATDVPAE